MCFLPLNATGLKCSAAIQNFYWKQYFVLFYVESSDVIKICKNAVKSNVDFSETVKYRNAIFPSAKNDGF